jgi:hypothetical protein
LAHHLFERRQFEIGVEDVEFGLVGDECRAGIFAVALASSAKAAFSLDRRWAVP